MAIVLSASLLSSSFGGSCCSTPGLLRSLKNVTLFKFLLRLFDKSIAYIQVIHCNYGCHECPLLSLLDLWLIIPFASP